MAYLNKIKLLNILEILPKHSFGHMSLYGTIKENTPTFHPQFWVQVHIRR